MPLGYAVLSGLFNFCQAARSKHVLNHCLHLHPPGYYHVERVFICLVAICVSSLEFLLKLFFRGRIVLFFLIYKSCLYIVDTTSSSWHLIVLPFLVVF